MTKYDPVQDFTFERSDEPLSYENDGHIGRYHFLEGGGTCPNGGEAVFWIRCPGDDPDQPQEHGKCGLKLICGHAVKADGTVQPSIGCAVCGFHAWATLADWDHGEVDRNGHLS